MDLFQIAGYFINLGLAKSYLVEIGREGIDKGFFPNVDSFAIALRIRTTIVYIPFLLNFRSNQFFNKIRLWFFFVFTKIASVFQEIYQIEVFVIKEGDINEKVSFTCIHLDV